MFFSFYTSIIRPVLFKFDPEFILGVSDGWKETPEDINDTNADINHTASKQLKDGQLYLIIGEAVYTATGQRIR